MKSAVARGGVVLLLFGCVKTEQISLTSTFDPNEAAYIKLPGTAGVAGDAFMRQNGGTVVTCAGSEVSLVPVTRYSTERVYAIYKSTEKGYRSFYAPLNISANADYVTYSRKTKCDAQGKFRFADIAPGDYYVATLVTWLASASVREGGTLMQKVTAQAGKTSELALSP